MRFRAFQDRIRWTRCRGCHCLCLHQGQGHNSKYVRTNVCVLNKNSNYRLDGNQTSLIDNSGTKEIRKTNCTYCLWIFQSLSSHWSTKQPETVNPLLKRKYS